ncbi:capsular biosynthesis protein [Marinomonas rhizomae]|uniref:Capsular polysaccharide export protein n=1 Tax=Marinomonas rhizomae TaxID=491948 RepID=A0A366JGJ1_9GAMM|nr:capsular biosynthesis protein [Marinomonas rhizomae]RBP85529.1 capsular polysaccharide export protein [Marinomonas rhizomae]RNF75831.1 capsular biosynthesis protein [Marinomonas rhizomae]
MSYLFISRKNVHSRYYKMIIKRLNLDAQLYIMGLPKLSSLLYLRQACRVDFRDICHEQLLRKRAYNPIWNHGPLSRLYSLVLTCIERLRYAKYLAVLKQKKPDYVVVWNGRKLPNSTIVMAAKSLDIKLFYFENGLLPKTVSLDPKGVNFASSLSSDPNFYLSFDPKNDCVFSAPEIVPRSNIRQRQKFAPIALPKRFIFVPFQVPHDTQIVCYSSWIDSMERFYDEVIQAVKTLHDPSLKVVFKEHPSWHKHYTSLYEKDDIALFANGNATTELIEKAEVILTINSTVGMESLLLNKAVITLGDACYNIEGLVLHANNRQQLSNCLNEVYQGWKMNPLLRDKFFSFLKNVYCVPRVTKDDDEHILAVKQRLTETDEFSNFERC